MAHELEIRNGQASMMYVGDRPWHGLGTALEEPATAAEAIKAAKMDWEVIKTPMYACVGNNRLVPTEACAVIRSDMVDSPQCEALGVVGRDYTPLQNRDAFRFFDPIVGESAAVYHTAGVLAGGRRVWILAKMPGEIRVIGDDISHKYLLLFNSHDGNSAMGIKFTPIRVVCQNTLTMALSEGRTLRVEHTPNLQRNIEIARENLGIIKAQFTNIEAAFQAMARVQMTGNRLPDYLGNVFPYPFHPGDEKRIGRVNAQREWAARFFHEGKGNQEKGTKETLWAAYNGVTEYVDHCMGRQQTRQAHLNRMWFGTGCDIKVRAYRVAELLARMWSN